MKHFFLIFSILFFISSKILHAQSGIVWGAPTTPVLVQVDTIGGGIKVTWSNRKGTNINGFSPRRFYHLWVEQFDATANTWRIDSTHAHYFVSDTVWIADSLHSLGNNPTDPIRFKIAPYRDSSITMRLLSTSTELIEHPEDTRTSSAILPSANNVLFCCIDVVVDTRTVAPGATNRLGVVALNPDAIIINNNAQLTALPNWIPSPTLRGKESMINTKQTTVSGGTTPLLYSNSTTAVSFMFSSTATTADIRTTIRQQLAKLLPIVQERLRTAGYSNYTNFPVTLVVLP